MYKLLHIFTDNKFFYDSDKFINDSFYNEILFIGPSSDLTIGNLEKSKFSYKIFEDTIRNANLILEHANKFNGVVFYSLSEPGVQLLLNINSNVKTFLRFFGWELYGFYIQNYLSEKTSDLHPKKSKGSFNNILKELYLGFKRKIKIALNKEYTVKLDNQRRVYKRLDAVMMINQFEYSELRELFYLPKLIEIQLTTHPYPADQFIIGNQKLNKIILGNSGANVNNHVDVLDIIKESNYNDNIEFYMFFSYGNTDAYAQNVKKIAQSTKDVKLIENFLSKDEFESIYTNAAALVINSYRQHATANIFIAIKNGCKVYLNKKSSTYKWLISKGLLISDVDDDLKRDLETGNYRLSLLEQQKNSVTFLKIINQYTVNDFLNNVINVLDEKVL